MASGLIKNVWPRSSLPLVVFLLVAAILTDSLTAGQVKVRPNTAVLNEGDRTELLCLHEGPINYCRMEIPGEKVLNLSPDWNKTPGLTYHGAGLAAGECGVSVERVKAINNGQVKCSLGVEGEEKTGLINLVVALRPQQPIIELLTKADREGSQFEALCTVRDGRPPANISWYIDDQPANKQVSELMVDASPMDPSMNLSTTKRSIQWQLSPEDNGRKLVCRSHHQTDRENVPPQEGAYLIQVRFAPLPQPEILVYGLYLDHTASINVTIRANPAPSIEWTVDGVVTRQRSQNDRFEASDPQYLGQDYYNVTLTIAGLTLEDTTKTYHLKASNALGVTDYTVRISSSTTPPVAGLDVGAIVGIVVAVAVLILIVLLIVFARATGRWCFGGKSFKSPTNETANKASHGRGQHVALLETPNGVTIIGNKHTNDDDDDDDGADATRGVNGHEGNNVAMLRRHASQTALEEEDDSFEYATDRESSVYNPTTVPIRCVMAAAGGRNSQKQSSASNESAGESADLLTQGNQLGIPESRFSRWLPKDQREILEKQAKLLANRVRTRTRPEGESTTTVAAAAAAAETPKPKHATESALETKMTQETDI